jgi:hypothetical protein
MSTPMQLTANRANAAHSTGPRTATGKARSSKNALRHGLGSALPVLPGESPRAWEDFRDGIVASLAPAGPLETELAGRVALSLWRLRRMAAYEAACVAAGIEDIAEESRRAAEKLDDLLVGLEAEHERPLPARLAMAEQELAKRRQSLERARGPLECLERLVGLPDDAPIDGGDAWAYFERLGGALPEGTAAPDPDDKTFLAAVGVPPEECDPDRAYDWEGWTVGMARRGQALLAQAGGLTAEQLLGRALGGLRYAVRKPEEEEREARRKVQDLRRRLKAQEERQRLLRVVPDGPTMDKVMRYEGHATRQMLQALHTLERLQAARAGAPVPAPAALDVTVYGEAPAAAVPLLEGPGA